MSLNNHAGPLSVDEARQRILDLCALRRTSVELVEIGAAHRRVLAQDARAPRDLPPFANSAMDGFAVRGADLRGSGERRLRIVGTRLAGSAEEYSLGPGECVRVMTGAVLPIGADTVVIKERAWVDGDHVTVQRGETAGANVRPAGEDFQAGEIVVRGGQRLTFPRLAALASLGLARIEVSRRPRVSLMTTGDELVMPGGECSAAQIYNSNGFSLSAMIALSGAELVVPGRDHGGNGFTHVRDDPNTIREALIVAAGESEVLITSGGVSAGEADFLPGLVADLGCVHFWKVRMRPGLPFLCGEIDRALVFCLPGNPVSTMATFLGLVRPALSALEGSCDIAPHQHPAKLRAAIHKPHDRTEFLRACSEIDGDGTLWVHPITHQGSAMLRGVIDANCLIVVPESAHDLEFGEIVQIMPLPE